MVRSEFEAGNWAHVFLLTTQIKVPLYHLFAIILVKSLMVIFKANRKDPFSVESFPILFPPFSGPWGINHSLLGALIVLGFCKYCLIARLQLSWGWIRNFFFSLLLLKTALVTTVDAPYVSCMACRLDFTLLRHCWGPCGTPGYGEKWNFCRGSHRILDGFLLMFRAQEQLGT